MYEEKIYLNIHEDIFLSKNSHLNFFKLYSNFFELIYCKTSHKYIKIHFIKYRNITNPRIDSS